MTNIEKFLRARIEEDEQRATAAGHGCGYVFHEHNAGWVEIELPSEHNTRPSYEVRHISAWSPDRVMAECEAKRELLTLYQIAGTIRPPDMGWHLLKSALYAAAAVYADHPDFKPEWAQGQTQKPPA